MPPSRVLSSLVFALGLVCAGLLIWLWRRSLPADSAGTAPAGAGVVA
ncbi:MAG: hypothetical protein JNL92_17240, partial [Opitutaceae bacterium]|nr:hypothetical protein [Opitutaceae bacterium]